MRIGAALLTAGVVVVSVSCTLRGTVGVVDSEQTGLGTSGTGQDTNDEGEILDVAGTDGNICVDRGLINGEGDCEPAPISGDLQPALEWSWSGEGEDTDTLVIPLVINLTDDDGNGRVDLCDTPDVLVTAGPPAAAVPISDPRAHIYALDGATGSVHWVSEVLVRGTITPAVGDINGDGRVEVVTLAPATECDQVRPTPPQYYSQLVAIADDGSLHWRSPHCFGATQADAVALAHLQDGNRADIMVADRVFAANGAFRFAATVTGPDEDTPRVAPLFPFAIDLDGDSTTAPDLEVVWPHVVRDGDGTLLFEDMDERGGFIHAANFDGDPAPELVLASDAGLVL
ncbi:MAG: hypothetical protein K0V04_39530, partial [Deltaproteobacteria bacterium]|nr:hypothetical protein [Deltaproteobacteria bacterium]